ncbi:hypothetical protein Pcinc_021834 [Petrolisthes cinctipes]|uniref:Uncharacterized protein n=1 Tax=Petrolisthes cinctipes TaxID=88211 RepID=A0AAE1KJ91_PETCI|nr:hypothetical protein Pcinc_021834 [Petrolisthes cinctipes]
MIGEKGLSVNQLADRLGPTYPVLGKLMVKRRFAGRHDSGGPAVNTARRHEGQPGGWCSHVTGLRRLALIVVDLPSNFFLYPSRHQNGLRLSLTWHLLGTKMAEVVVVSPPFPLVVLLDIYYKLKTL